jgi:DNA-directed RNA polymerase subunit omega
VDQVDSNKPLSIALEEIAATKIVPQYPGDARRQAEELLGGEGEGEGEDGDDGDDTGAEIVELGLEPPAE